MDVVYRCCCGVDVHKNSITACVLWAEAKGRSRQEKRMFGTFTQDLLGFSDWLRECGVTHVAMESTGVYGKPVWHVLEGQFELLLVNAQHVKAIPGKKTDRKDSAWLAELLQHGLLKSSFVRPNRFANCAILRAIGSIWRKNVIASRIEFRRCSKMPTLSSLRWQRTLWEHLDERC